VNISPTQIDFKRPPEEWGNALFTQIKDLLDELNGQTIPRIAKIEERLVELDQAINSISRLIRG